jgi:hypothetical protein
MLHMAAGSDFSLRDGLAGTGIPALESRWSAGASFGSIRWIEPV